MGKIILILGGARSGKSMYALRLAKKYKKVGFIATCQALDKEMRERILKHQKTRPKNFKTFEEFKDPLSLLNRIKKDFDCIIIDCLTLLVSNLILDGYKENEVLKNISNLLGALKKASAESIIVSNETGLGIVPAHKLGRDFRDIIGRVNQLVAKDADEVFFIVAGLAMTIKK